MEDAAKIISLLLLVFTLSTEANHGGEYSDEYTLATFS